VEKPNPDSTSKDLLPRDFSNSLLLATLLPELVNQKRIRMETPSDHGLVTKPKLLFSNSSVNVLLTIKLWLTKKMVFVSTSTEEHTKMPVEMEAKNPIYSDILSLPRERE